MANRVLYEITSVKNAQKSGIQSLHGKSKEFWKSNDAVEEIEFLISFKDKSRISRIEIGNYNVSIIQILLCESEEDIHKEKGWHRELDMIKDQRDLDREEPKDHDFVVEREDLFKCARVTIKNKFHKLIPIQMKLSYIVFEKNIPNQQSDINKQKQQPQQSQSNSTSILHKQPFFFKKLEKQQNDLDLMKMYGQPDQMAATNQLLTNKFNENRKRSPSPSLNGGKNIPQQKGLQKKSFNDIPNGSKGFYRLSNDSKQLQQKNSLLRQQELDYENAIKQSKLEEENRKKEQLKQKTESINNPMSYANIGSEYQIQEALRRSQQEEVEKSLQRLKEDEEFKRAMQESLKKDNQRSINELERQEEQESINSSQTTQKKENKGMEMDSIYITAEKPKGVDKKAIPIEIEIQDNSFEIEIESPKNEYLIKGSIGSPKQQGKDAQSNHQNGGLSHFVLEHYMLSETVLKQQKEIEAKRGILLGNTFFKKQLNHIFKNKIFCISGFEGEERNKIKCLITDLGGKIYQDMTQDCEFLICADNRTAKFKEYTQNRNKYPILQPVKRGFLIMCKSERKITHVDPFLIK